MPQLPHFQPCQTCSAFCLSVWWSVVAPQVGHQERGSRIGLAAAAPDYIPVVQRVGYLSVYRGYNPDGGLHLVAA